MNIFQLGDFTLNSGAKSSWKLECDALTDADIAALAEMIRLMVGPFSVVSGVPRGGLRLEIALRPFVSLAGPLLVVDDVLTTGNSMIRHRDSLIVPGLDTQRAIGAVVFARGQCPSWVKAVLQMPECFWLQPRTRGDA